MYRTSGKLLGIKENVLAQKERVLITLASITGIAFLGLVWKLSKARYYKKKNTYYIKVD